MENEIVLSDGDVVSMLAEDGLVDAPTAKIIEIKNALADTWLVEHSAWVEKGVPCEVLLTQGGGWQKGRIRLRIEFIPEDSNKPSEQITFKRSILMPPQ
jgi:uncharacterized protein (DUF302 family)